MKRMLRVVLTTAVVAILVGGSMFGALQRQILFPTHAIPDPPAGWPGPVGLERVDLEIEEGLVEGWFLRGDGCSNEKPGPVVFFGHGNGELIDYAAPALEPYRRRGISVALLEYRGYGRSKGSPSQDGIVDDMTRFHDRITARPEVDASRVVFHGRSLGGGVVCALSRVRKPRVMILESTFRSVVVMARKFLMPSFLVRDPFDNEGALAELDAPVLLFHGERDDLIPFEHGQALVQTARDGHLKPLACGHNDLPPDPREYWAEIDAFMGRNGVLP